MNSEHIRFIKKKKCNFQIPKDKTIVCVKNTGT